MSLSLFVWAEVSVSLCSPGLGRLLAPTVAVRFSPSSGRSNSKIGRF